MKKIPRIILLVLAISYFVLSSAPVLAIFTGLSIPLTKVDCENFIIYSFYFPPEKQTIIVLLFIASAVMSIVLTIMAIKNLLKK